MWATVSPVKAPCHALSGAPQGRKSGVGKEGLGRACPSPQTTRPVCGFKNGPIAAQRGAGAPASRMAGIWCAGLPLWNFIPAISLREGEAARPWPRCSNLCSVYLPKGASATEHLRISLHSFGRVGVVVCRSVGGRRCNARYCRQKLRSFSLHLAGTDDCADCKGLANETLSLKNQRSIFAAAAAAAAALVLCAQRVPTCHYQSALFRSDVTCRRIGC